MTYVSNKLYSMTLSGSILKHILEKYIIHFIFFSFWLLLILVSQKEFLIYQIFWCIISKWTPGNCFKICIRNLSLPSLKFLKVQNRPHFIKIKKTSNPLEMVIQKALRSENLWNYKEFPMSGVVGSLQHGSQRLLPPGIHTFCTISSPWL